MVTPIESTIVTIAGKPSGIAATARPTEVINISTGGICFIIPIIKITAHIARQATPKTFPTSPNFFCIGVSGSSSVIIIFAILPTLVFIPVSTTTASPCPFTTTVVANAIFKQSAIHACSFKIALQSFSTGTVSPVKLDSSIFKLYVLINLQSAGTTPPASKTTTSPGTNWSLFICLTFPSLLTFTTGAVIFLSASSDFSAFASCTTPIIALNTTIPIIIIESR